MSNFKKMFFSIATVMLLGWFLSAMAGETVTYDWAQLEQNVGPPVPHKVGQVILFCDANANPTYCVKSATPPPEIPCLSAHTVQVGGSGSYWILLGSIRAGTARLGPADCHGIQIPAGTWQLINGFYKQ